MLNDTVLSKSRDPVFAASDLSGRYRVPAPSLSGEPPLPGLPQPLHAPSRLGRMDGERFDAQLRQGSLDLRGVGGALEPVRTPPRPRGHKVARRIGYFTCYRRRTLHILPTQAVEFALTFWSAV